MERKKSVHLLWYKWVSHTEKKIDLNLDVAFKSLLRLYQCEPLRIYV